MVGPSQFGRASSPSSAHVVVPRKQPSTGFIMRPFVPSNPRCMSRCSAQLGSKQQCKCFSSLCSPHKTMPHEIQRSRPLPSLRPGSRDEVDGCGKLGHSQSAAPGCIKCSENLVISQHGSKYAQDTAAREAPSYHKLCQDSSLARTLEHGSWQAHQGRGWGGSTVAVTRCLYTCTQRPSQHKRYHLRLTV